MDKVINLSNDKNFIGYPYLQSKKTYKAITDSDWTQTISNLDNSRIKNIENPFSIWL